MIAHLFILNEWMRNYSFWMNKWEIIHFEWIIHLLTHIHFSSESILQVSNCLFYKLLADSFISFIHLLKDLFISNQWMRNYSFIYKQSSKLFILKITSSIFHLLIWEFFHSGNYSLIYWNFSFIVMFQIVLSINDYSFFILFYSLIWKIIHLFTRIRFLVNHFIVCLTHSLLSEPHMAHNFFQALIKILFKKLAH